MQLQVTCIYLFHELPPEVRAKVAKEMARVVKPGGMVVLTDSAQLGDRPAWDAVSIARLSPRISICQCSVNVSIACTCPMHIESAAWLLACLSTRPMKRAALRLLMMRLQPMKAIIENAMQSVLR